MAAIHPEESTTTRSRSRFNRKVQVELDQSVYQGQRVGIAGPFFLLAGIRSRWNDSERREVRLVKLSLSIPDLLTSVSGIPNLNLFDHPGHVLRLMLDACCLNWKFCRIDMNDN